MAITEGLNQFVIRRNAEQSDAFTDPAARMERQLYRQKHPTEIIALKCMDGRLNLAIYTETPPGIIQPFRNIGGKFNLGWPFFQVAIKELIEYALSKGRRTVILITYHFSKSETHRGCAGFGYDTVNARSSAFELRRQFEKVFGRSGVYPIVVGIETDEEALTFHGETGDVRVSELSNADTVGTLVESLYPDMDRQMIKDLTPLVSGNYRHVMQVRERGKEPIDHEHREQIIAVGRGFDWLHMPNAALIIGPYSHDWQVAVEKAGQIALSNLRDNRIPEEFGVLLLIAALSRDELKSYGWNLAEEKAIDLMRNSRRVLEERVPELIPHLQFMCGVVDAQTRKLHHLQMPNNSSPQPVSNAIPEDVPEIRQEVTMVRGMMVD